MVVGPELVVGSELVVEPELVGAVNSRGCAFMRPG